MMQGKRCACLSCELLVFVCEECGLLRKYPQRIMNAAKEKRHQEG